MQMILFSGSQEVNNLQLKLKLDNELYKTLVNDTNLTSSKFYVANELKVD